MRLRVSVEVDIPNEQLTTLVQWLAEEKVIVLQPHDATEAPMYGTFAGATEVFGAG